MREELQVTFEWGGIVNRLFPPHGQHLLPSTTGKRRERLHTLRWPGGPGLKTRLRKTRWAPGPPRETLNRGHFRALERNCPLNLNRYQLSVKMTKRIFRAHFERKPARPRGRKGRWVSKGSTRWEEGNGAATTGVTINAAIKERHGEAQVQIPRR